MNIYQDKFASRKFGIFNHFLYGVPGGSAARMLTRVDESAEWKRQCESFDPERIAYDLNRIGAGYYFITLMQGQRFMLAPNATFDRICGTKPGEACSERDIVAELIAALRKYDIDLGLYFTGDGPYKDEKCGNAFGFTSERGTVDRRFVEKWALVLEEYAMRYGDGIKAWWIDGCYDAENGSRLGYTQELLEIYYNAAKKGNPNVLVACNNGVQRELYKWYEKDDFTSGEQNFFTHVPPSRFIDGALAHYLIPLGLSYNGKEWGGWRQRGTRITREQLQKYISYVNDTGGVVTVDIFIDHDGNWDEEQLAILEDLLK